MRIVLAHRTDTIPSLALYLGFFWKTLWNHPNNAELKAQRKHLNVLHSGDKVWIPDLRQKYEPLSTDTQHRFRRKGDPAKISFKLMKSGKPRANIPYVLKPPACSAESPASSTVTTSRKSPTTT